MRVTKITPKSKYFALGYTHSIQTWWPEKTIRTCYSDNRLSELDGCDSMGGWVEVITPLAQSKGPRHIYHYYFKGEQGLNIISHLLLEKS